MEISAIVPWLSSVSILISLGTSVTIFLTSGSKKNAVTLDEHEKRLSKVENELSHMPNAETVHQLQLTITEIKGQMGVMAKSAEATERTTRRVEEFLIQKGR
ncbi:DUF2730 family protein [Ochrobactrum sp. XJ1]|nr:DUF2730 family protein [Ochrobactrum sp. XJ1]